MDFNFDKNQTVDSIDAVPEPFRPFYVEADGKFKLDDKFKGAAGSVDGLTRSLGGARKEAKDTKAFIEDWKKLGFESAADARAHLDDLNEKLTKGEKINVDKIRQDMQAGFDKEKGVLNDKLTKKDKAIQKYLVDSAATAALAAEKGVPELLLPHIRGKVKVIEDGEEFKVIVVDASGETRHNHSGLPMTIVELVKEMKGDKLYSRAFESDAGSGNGTPAGGTQQKQAQNKQDQNKNMSATDKISAGLSARNKN